MLLVRISADMNTNNSRRNPPQQNAALSAKISLEDVTQSSYIGESYSLWRLS